MNRVSVDIVKESLLTILNSKTNLVSSDEFYLLKAQQELNAYKELDMSEGDVDRMIDMEYGDFCNDDDKLTLQVRDLLFRIISYCDYHAKDKSLYNQYDDKRVVSKSMVRQNSWVRNLLKWKKNKDDSSVADAIKNTINYLLDPSKFFPVVSESHKRLIALNVIGEEYEKETFEKRLLDYMNQFGIHCECRENDTYFFIHALYNISNMWNSEEDREFTRSEILSLYKEYIRRCTDSKNSVENYSEFKRLNELIINCIDPNFKCLENCTLSDVDTLQSIYEKLLEFKSFELFKDNKSNKDKDFVHIGGGQYHNALKTFIRFFSAMQLFSSQNLLVFNSCYDKLNSSLPLQRIFYGAPGTGKSHKIDEQTNDDNSIRTTFHPDTDYATFVGAYKPMMDTVDEYALDATGKTHKIDYPNGKSSIIYKYEPQVFLKAYVEAWKRYLNKQEGEDDSYYLVIEEINRGNCAQIFGDLFQLLDREDNGCSSYAISPESSITKYLAKEAKSTDGTKFSDLNFRDVKKERDGVEKTIATADELKKGEKLVLPPNLYIWATMNTSDQSLFPIDSAFKRRWDWKYVKIKDGKKNWKIDVKLDDENVDWWAFIQKINAIIASMTSSADKQLGYFFCKADKDGVISTETFVSKVIFYLWNDVFKDYGFEDASLFRYKVKEGEKEVEKDLTFPDFYGEDGENVNTECLGDFIRNVMNWQNREGNI